MDVVPYNTLEEWLDKMINNYVNKKFSKNNPKHTKEYKASVRSRAAILKQVKDFAQQKRISYYG